MKFDITKIAPRYILDWYLLPSRRRNTTGLPTVLNLPITDNCNSRCIMCDVWKTKSNGEVTAQELRSILEDKLFSRIEHVGISGGEPTLRADLVEVVAVILATLGRLRSISITSHGFHTARWQIMLPKIRELCSRQNIRFTLNLSLDGIDRTHDDVRQIPGGYDRVIKTYELARRLDVNVTFQTTISKPNIHGVVNILNTTSSLGTDVDFRLATEIERLENHESMKQVGLNPHERSFFADFLISSSLLEKTRSPARRLFYRDLSKRLVTTAKRGAPCYYQREGILLTSHGDLYHCSISKISLGNAKTSSPIKLYFDRENEIVRTRMIKETCPGCFHDQSGAWSPSRLTLEVLRQKKIGRQLLKLSLVIRTLVMAIPYIIRIIIGRAKKPLIINHTINKVLCIGMYGGEHVGDAAILGGVILRLIKKYRVEEAYISSFRPDRTQRWLDSLELPIKMKVVSDSETKEFISKSNAIVLAGGPIMDLPEILLRQICYVGKGKDFNIPFIVEGVGIGPFKSSLAQRLARLLLHQATTISVRTKNDSQHKLLTDLQVQTLADPAFDYINHRQSSNLAIDQRKHFSRFLPDSKQSYEVGINLRPFWKKYVFSKENGQDLQNMFLLSFAGALVESRRYFNVHVNYYFFPMNSDQFGFSDLQIGYDLKRFLPSNFPLHILETEPDIDPLLQFIRRMDMVVAMRFHAAIFALSQNIPTIGIDYAFGQDGKVSKLFQESPYNNFVCRVDNFTQEWFVDRLKIIHESQLNG